MNSRFSAIPLEQPVATARGRRNMSIGLPCCIDPSEKRFPFTPEGVAMLTDRGYAVKMEQGAGKPIHYTDMQYTRAGAALVSRAEALGCDMVMHLAPLPSSDIRLMRRGAILFCLSNPERMDSGVLGTLLQRGVTTVGVDMVSDEAGNKPFADILAEIDGRAAMARAASLLADAVHGKGILLGGVAGLLPCEVMVIGSGIAACAAARSAVGAGAVVRMFDNDMYSLRDATRLLGPGVIGSAMHPRSLAGALATADVVVYTGTTPALHVDSDLVATMKRGVILFDLSGGNGKGFPSLPVVDLASAFPVTLSPVEPTRVCYVNAGSSVPRTAAMALSNTFITLLSRIAGCEGFVNALKLLPGLRNAALTYSGKVVHRGLAETHGMRYVDINIYLTLS